MDGWIGHYVSRWTDRQTETDRWVGFTERYICVLNGWMDGWIVQVGRQIERIWIGRTLY